MHIKVHHMGHSPRQCDVQVQTERVLWTKCLCPTPKSTRQAVTLNVMYLEVGPLEGKILDKVIRVGPPQWN